MSPLDAARAMAAVAHLHDPECAWAVLPRIVAALEQADRATLLYEETRLLFGTSAAFDAAMLALDGLLDADTPTGQD